jgi:DNA modification methylase
MTSRAVNPYYDTRAERRVGQLVESFLGSGTTGVAAVFAGKRFIDIERDPVCFEYARQRIAEAQQRVAA